MHARVMHDRWRDDGTTYDIAAWLGLAALAASSRSAAAGVARVPSLSSSLRNSQCSGFPVTSPQFRRLGLR
ncbi:hypothetical protein U9M48_023232 [Paspalum notatum var. saurae]|uniref:Uncharacterized protein n=1 Tax=Paspalum notatum var. saurae TaxID=547442 RepID=A0AAQ3WVQ2_PASNO